MDRLVVVKFHINIANRWLFTTQRKIMALTLYSQSYFDMFRGLFPDTVYCTLYGWCANYTDYSRRVHV